MHSGFIPLCTVASFRCAQWIRPYHNHPPINPSHDTFSAENQGAGLIGANARYCVPRLLCQVEYCTQVRINKPTPTPYLYRGGGGLPPVASCSFTLEMGGGGMAFPPPHRGGPWEGPHPPPGGPWKAPPPPPRGGPGKAPRGLGRSPTPTPPGAWEGPPRGGVGAFPDPQGGGTGARGHPPRVNFEVLSSSRPSKRLYERCNSRYSQNKVVEKDHPRKRSPQPPVRGSK